jgi:hypothetical protein
LTRDTCRAGAARDGLSTSFEHKLRRDELLTVTGIRRSRDGTAEAVLVARRLPDGSIRSAGAIELGLRRGIVEDFEQRLANLPVRRRGALSWYPAEVSVIASVHGPLDGPVRDAVLRGVATAPRSPRNIGGTPGDTS